MAKTILDRISMGRFENNDEKKVLDNRGEAFFKLNYDNHIAYKPYYIVGKLNHGGIISSGSVPQTKMMSKQEFLKEVNDDLSQIDCYLAEAKYSKVFTILGMHKVKGVLYREYDRNPHAKGKK